MAKTLREDIAIVGMACRFAESPTLKAFWRNIMQRKSLLTPLLSDDGGFYADRMLFDRPYPAVAGQLGDLYACAPADQVFPRQMNAGENQDVFFAVQLAVDALRDAQYDLNRSEVRRASLYLGYAPPFNASTVNWLQHTFFLDQTMDIVRKFYPGATQDNLDELRGKLSDSLPAPNADSFLTGIGHIMASWIAQTLSFGGAPVMVDAGAVTCHQTLSHAMDDLRMRRVDMALAGTIQPPLHRAFLQGLSGAMIFSRKTVLQPFGRDSEGTLPGEGGAFFVLKRLRDAQRAGNRVYAVLRSSATTFEPPDETRHYPSHACLERAYVSALDGAGLPPQAIQMVEAHGSGVSFSDQTEIEVVQKLLGEHLPGQQLVGLGSVKGNVGHTLWASGAAGMVKTALSLYHRVLAPQVAVEKPCTALMPVTSPVYLLNEARPWLRAGRTAPRRAIVSATDFTGSCAAAVLEESPEAR